MLFTLASTTSQDYFDCLYENIFQQSDHDAININALRKLIIIFSAAEISVDFQRFSTIAK